MRLQDFDQTRTLGITVSRLPPIAALPLFYFTRVSHLSISVFIRFTQTTSLRIRRYINQRARHSFDLRHSPTIHDGFACHHSDEA
jgi:hypothetical protein